MSIDGKRRTLRRAVKPERRLEDYEETEDDLKEDYEIKKKACSDLNECLKKQTEQVGKLYEYLLESPDPVSPTLYDTLCLDDTENGDGGLYVVADVIRFDQVSFCEKSLSAECEFRKKQAELEGKKLFIELKEVDDFCLNFDEVPCLNDYSFDKREDGFEKENFVQIMDDEYNDDEYNEGGDVFTCANLPSKYSVASEYLGTPELDYDEDAIVDYCFPVGE